MVMLIKLEGEKIGPRALGTHSTLEHFAVQAGSVLSFNPFRLLWTYPHAIIMDAPICLRARQSEPMCLRQREQICLYTNIDKSEQTRGGIGRESPGMSPGLSPAYFGFWFVMPPHS